MPQKLRVKKKKSFVLTPRSVETVESEEAPTLRQKRKITIQSSKAKLDEAAESDLGAHDNKSVTLKGGNEDLQVAEESETLETTETAPTELNSSTVKDSVPQVPLSTEEAETTQELPDPEEEHFKFFCYRCGQRLKVPVSWANKSTPCGRCGHDLVIPPPLVEDI